ncbi:MAG: hypothetical protein A2030_04390 [Chloroflexi bacterium RBG_19FT_COMBO_50_10]|nr:MAG: hypothetical protein A2030_04390 [Chloroflexi bacterium RBG_19FT_COMBO_50_10]
MGSKVTTSLDNTYGEKFSRTETGINSYSFEDTTTSQYYDQLIYNGTNYGIWEYPVLNVETGDPNKPATIMVVFPLVDTTTQPKTAQGRICDENFYKPSHQPYNVWSYDRIGPILFEDYVESGLVDSKQTQGGDTITIGMSNVSESQRMDSFSNQVSAGIEYSYENELDVPLIGKAWEFSFRASVKSQFGLEEISTLSSSYLTETKVTVDFPGIADPSAYDMIAYFYWAKAGYLVVDYQTQPASTGSWLLYDNEDPAFILPWYGFPDPETGQFPTLPDPDAPACGLDKQLFTHDIEINPTYAENQDTVTITATVRNFSNVTPEMAVLVNFYLGRPAGGNWIASCSIEKELLARVRGPAYCTATWQVVGASGEEKIYAVIDPLGDLTEMHDEDDFIDNNVGYGLLYVANADYFDPGLKQTQYYQSILYEADPGLGYGLYIPTSNSIETVRYELVPKDLGNLSIVGVPIEVTAFLGGEPEDDEDHVFDPIPAGLVISYSDDDLLPGMVESNLKLYRLDGNIWEEHACPDAELIRFDNNIIAAPICQTGVYVLSDAVPELLQKQIYLPVIGR